MPTAPPAVSVLQGRPVAEGLPSLRRQLIDTLWRSMFWIALLGGPLSASRAMITGWLPLYTLQLATAVLIMSLALLRHRISEAWLAALFLAVLWLVGLPGLFTLGLAASSVWWLVLSAFLASALYSLRIGVIMAIGTGAALSLAALGFISGWLHFPVDFAAYQRLPGPWLALILISGAFAFFTLRALGSYNQAVLRLLNEVAAKRAIATELYEQAPCGYHSLDAEGRITRINATERGWLGQADAALLGSRFQDWLSPASQPRWEAHLQALPERRRIGELELELRLPDGQGMPVLLSSQAQYDAEGAYRGSRSTLFDITERKQMERRIETLARTDPLTGALNRRAFQAAAEACLAAAAQGTQAPVCLLMIDIDHFKAINDQHGHAGGDRVLQQMAALLQSALRSQDVFARLGGEEFALLLPATSLDQAALLADRLRQRIGDHPMRLDDGQTLHITVSMGLAAPAAPLRALDRLLQEADRALYRAKHQGRNRVVVHTPT